MTSEVSRFVIVGKLKKFKNSREHFGIKKNNKKILSKSNQYVIEPKALEDY